MYLLRRRGAQGRLAQGRRRAERRARDQQDRHEGRQLEQEIGIQRALGKDHLVEIDECQATLAARAGSCDLADRGADLDLEAVVPEQAGQAGGKRWRRLDQPDQGAIPVAHAVRGADTGPTHLQSAPERRRRHHPSG
ncbi:MAG: hypothetical protein JO023_07295 [Chloroflexi bacterium]|nr:hypothetical protein [Chloroflexota bacterium]